MEKAYLINLSGDSMFVPIHFNVIFNQIRKIKGTQINLGVDSNPIKILFILA